MRMTSHPRVCFLRLHFLTVSAEHSPLARSSISTETGAKPTYELVLWPILDSSGFSAFQLLRSMGS